MSYLPKDTQQVGGGPGFEANTLLSSLSLASPSGPHGPLPRDAFLPAPLHPGTVLSVMIRWPSAGAPLSACC